MKSNKVVPIVSLVAVMAILIPGLAFAGTTGVEFQPLYQKVSDWAGGYLGKTFAIVSFLLGLGVGAVKQTPIPALSGIVFALFIVYVPTIINSVVTAVV